MSYFLLLKSPCKQMEQLIVKFWWQKGHGREGIRWCASNHTCRSKEERSMGFRSMSKFNISLLAKQGWRLINILDSLLSRVLKAK